jgi:hypothetical protein
MRNEDTKYGCIGTVGELISELQKYPSDAKIRAYPERWSLRDSHGGDLKFASYVLGVETCDDDKTVAIVHNWC